MDLNKRGQTGLKLNMNTILIGVALLFVFYSPFQQGVLGLFSGGAGPATVPTGSTQLSGGVPCVNDGTTLTIGPMIKKYGPTTSVSTEYAGLWINGIWSGLKADSSTKEVGVGDNVVVAYALNSSTYHTSKSEFVVPCTAAYDSSSADDAYMIYSYATPSITIFNEDDGDQNSRSNNESVANSENPILKARVSWGSKAGYSVFGKKIISFKYNDTVFDTIGLSSVSGIAVSTVGTPQFRSTANSTGEFSFVSYSVPGHQSQGALVEEYEIELDADDTNDPAADDDLIMFIDDEDYYRNTVSNVLEFGAEDDLDADVGTTTERSVIIYVS